jgi:hypothetical protein
MRTPAPPSRQTAAGLPRNGTSVNARRPAQVHAYIFTGQKCTVGEDKSTTS